MDSLSEEVLLHIFYHVANSSVRPSKDIATCSQICKLWNSIVQDNVVWNSVCKNECPIQYESHKLESIDWRQVFARHMKVRNSWYKSEPKQVILGNFFFKICFHTKFL